MLQMEGREYNLYKRVNVILLEQLYISCVRFFFLLFSFFFLLSVILQGCRYDGTTTFVRLKKTNKGEDIKKENQEILTPKYNLY
jgi:hypothetical protein